MSSTSPSWDLRIHVVAALLAAASATWTGAQLLTVVLRLDLGRSQWPVVVALVCWTAAVVALPRHASLAVFLAIPFLANRPGDLLPELLDLLVAAATLGLTIQAWRERRPPPGGTLWRSALLVVLSAAIALVATLPAALVRGAQVGTLQPLVAETLSAAETVPLYAVASVIQLLIAAGWAFALTWWGADVAFARSALRYVALGLLLVMLVGILGVHGILDIPGDLLGRIDPHIAWAPEGIQSVFWNPAWFASYFALAFGLSIGLLWIERGPVRPVVALGLVVSYAYFLTNRQRGGFLAVQAVLLALVAWVSGRHRPWRLGVLIAASVLLPLVFVWSGLVDGHGWLQSAQRLLGHEVDVNRWTLWRVAFEMWRSAPILGLGEGAFGWHYRIFVPAGSEGDIGPWGTAHSTWLQLMATRGLVGLAAFLLLLTVLGREALAAARSAGPRRGVGLGLVLALVALTVYGTVQWLFYLQSLQVLFWGMVALAAASSSREDAGGSRARRVWALAALAAAAALVAQIAKSGPLYAEAVAEIDRQPPGFYRLAEWAGRGELVRWSSRKGTLWLYPTGPVMTLQVMTTDPRSETRPVTVTLAIGGRVLDRFALFRGATQRSVFLPEAYLHRPPPSPPPFGERLLSRLPLPLEVKVSRLWSPSLYGSLDGRFLGVAVFEPSFRKPRPGEEIGAIAWPDERVPGVRWARSRWSLSIDVPAGCTELLVPMRPAVSKGPPVQVEAFWDQRAVGLTHLGADGWEQMRISLPSSTRRGVLTLQADHVWPRPGRGGEDVQWAALRLRLPTACPGS